MSRLAEFASAEGLALPRLLAARETTEARLARRRALLDEHGLPHDLCVVFVGSWGRGEVTKSSDNDFYLLTQEETLDEGSSHAAAVEEALRREEAEYSGDDAAALPPPGRERVFGAVPVPLERLVKNIGLNRDDNENLTQRMLLVLESVAVRNADLHADARRAVIDTYLEIPVKGHQPPRLFLNDVVRYWRTMCVDFAGKMRDRDGQGWGLRNAKLRTTRKLLFASGFVPLLRCSLLDEDDIAPFLVEQFGLRPMDRLAEAFVALDERDPGVRVLEAYERFLASLHDRGVRDALDSIKSRAAADRSDVFQSVARLGDQVEAGLLDVIFGDSLAEASRRYGIF